MKTHTTMLCYMNGEIITCSNDIRYSCPLAKVVVKTLVQHLMSWKQIYVNHFQLIACKLG